MCVLRGHICYDQAKLLGYQTKILHSTCHCGSHKHLLGNKVSKSHSLLLTNQRKGGRLEGDGVKKIWGLSATSGETQAEWKRWEKEKEVGDTETDGEKYREEERPKGGRVAATELPFPACK